MPARETTARIVRFWPGWRSVRRLGANTHECNHLSPLLKGLTEGTTVYADKGYDSKENRQHLKEHQLLDGIMRKACRNRPLTEVQTKRNRYLSKTRYVVEQSFGTLYCKFRYARTAKIGRASCRERV